jgi:hypothetical protein
MKRKRSKQGGTLALVVALILVLVIVGIGFILWNFLIGGSAQVRNLTDSGVLNVAKQALINPFLTIAPNRVIAGLNVETVFGDELEGTRGNRRLTLRAYNRLVAKTVFAQLNASSPNNATPAARANAQRMTIMLNQLGSELAATLNSFNNLRGNFENVAQQGTVNKLRNTTTDVTITARNVHDVAFAARPSGPQRVQRNASNVFLEGIPANPPPNFRGPFPPGVNVPAFLDRNTVVKNINGTPRVFLAGYSPLTSAAPVNAQVTYCVPLRPGEQPHSVSNEDFRATTNPPLNGPGIAQVIANTFRGGSNVTNPLLGGNSAAQMESAAVVGAGATIFTGGQQEGTFIIDNQGVDPLQSRSGDRTVPSAFTDGLMEPNAFEIFEVRLNTAAGVRWGDNTQTPRRYACPAPTKFTPPAAWPSARIQSLAFNFAPLDPGGSPIPTPAPIPSVMRIGPPFPAAPRGGDDDFIFRQTVQYRSVIASRNVIMNTPASLSSPGQSNTTPLKAGIIHLAVCSDEDLDPDDPPPCPTFAPALGALASGQILSGTGQLQTNLMTLEQYVLAIRGAFTGPSGAGCIASPPFGVPGLNCVTQQGTFIGSGLKDIRGTTIPFPNPNPTLGLLMQFTGLDRADIMADFSARVTQIGGNANVGALLGTPIPFNSIVYITKAANGTVTSSPTPPPGLTYRGPGGQPYDQQNRGARPLVDPTLNVPDGNRIQTQSNFGASAISRVFVPFAFWECGNGQRSGRMASYGRYVPSTGLGGLLGVFRFVNCPEATGPNWCCP